MGVVKLKLKQIIVKKLCSTIREIYVNKKIDLEMCGIFENNHHVELN